MFSVAAAGGGVNALGVPMPDGTGNSLMMGRGAGALAAAGLGGGAIRGGAAQGSDFMHVTRQARRLYVGNLPFGAQQVGPPVVSVFGVFCELNSGPTPP